MRFFNGYFIFKEEDKGQTGLCWGPKVAGPLQREHVIQEVAAAGWALLKQVFPLPSVDFLGG